MHRSVVLVVALAACGQATNSVDGRELFTTYCTTCHGPKGKPDDVMVAKLGVKDLTSPELRKTLDAPKVAHQIQSGSKDFRMPAFAGTLTEVQIQALAAYVVSPEFLKR